MQSFSLNMPFDLVKSGREDEMRIGGYASTDNRDRHDESVIQKGLDISEFVSSGFFNLDHDNSKILGYPDQERCGIDDRGLYVEGTLLNGVPEAESIYRTAVALKKSNAPRRLGFSVEGQILAKDRAGFITKAKVYNVAITASPVNPACTWEALCKSFAANAALDTYAETSGLNGPMDTQKCAPLIPESLESSIRNLTHIIEQDEDAFMDALKRILRGSEPQYGDLALYYTLTRGLPWRESMALAASVLS